MSYAFLKPDKIMDKAKRRPDHPDYDPGTLYVPKGKDHWILTWTEQLFKKFENAVFWGIFQIPAIG